VEGGSNPHYISTGHLAFGQAGALMAVPFDAARLGITGAPVRIQAEILTKGSYGLDFAVAVNGTVLYVPGDASSALNRFIWRGRDGKSTAAAIADVLDNPRYPRLSPDGHRLVATLGPAQEGQIWVYDLTGAAQPLKLTFENHNTFPAWTPDGRRIIFTSNTNGVQGLFSLPADGSVLEPQRLPIGDTGGRMPALSPVGNSLVFVAGRGTAPTGDDLWLMSTDGSRKPAPWLQTQFAESEPSFSVDGAWLAYVSDQTGADEVWVRPFPGPGVPHRVSSGGGHDPIWPRDKTDKELFYQNGGQLMAIDVIPKDAEIRFGPPKTLFAGGFVPWLTNLPRTYDVGQDGRFLMIESRANAASAPSFVVVLNRFEELKARVPTK
jgi:Tol biopolymer transport system component